MNMNTASVVLKLAEGARKPASIMLRKRFIEKQKEKEKEGNILSLSLSVSSLYSFPAVH
jgi:hypothetical protein